ncbi:hypothetical protein BW247_01860 [Acidihalobacter ferrooxydans]|uniref:LysM domain-containing protein n=2 Tax=Acidihalobacter ferrooxydans TaxID=1765967 RepID=A0A1P8UDQ5_9GAMM|nr:hypothetical protein BW247_01860 [Acidihalobacter ferrooxydans]
MTPSSRHQKKVTVRAGDSLWLLAHQHGDTVKQLVKWNHLASAKVPLHIGQKIVVQAPSSASKKAS